MIFAAVASIAPRSRSPDNCFELLSRPERAPFPHDGGGRYWEYVIETRLTCAPLAERTRRTSLVPLRLFAGRGTGNGDAGTLGWPFRNLNRLRNRLAFHAHWSVSFVIARGFRKPAQVTARARLNKGSTRDV